MPDLTRRHAIAAVVIAVCSYAVGYHVGAGEDDGALHYRHVFNKECDWRDRGGMVMVNWFCDSTGHRPIRSHTDADE